MYKETKELIGGALIIGAGIVGVIAMGWSARPSTPIGWQNQDMKYLGPTYTLELASDGCYWRNYFREGSRHTHRRIDIIPDGAGGKENCPYRK